MFCSLHQISQIIIYKYILIFSISSILGSQNSYRFHKYYFNVRLNLKKYLLLKAEVSGSKLVSGRNFSISTTLA